MVTRSPVDAWLAEHQAMYGTFSERAALAPRPGGVLIRRIPAPRRCGRVNLVLDAGALIGIDRADPLTAGLIELGRRSDAGLVTAAPVIAQAWRGSVRQARLARLLAIIDVRSTHIVDARAAGELLAVTGTADVVDAQVALPPVPEGISYSPATRTTCVLSSRGVGSR